MAKLIDPAIGIDLGTTYSVLAVLDADGKPQTIRNAEGDTTTPSVVYFDQRGPVVGKEAQKAAAYEPDLVVQFAKREMGKPTYHKPIRGERVPPEIPQALVLQKLKHDASQVIGTCTKAVITVPAYYNEPRRKATQDAGELAGLDVLDIINEPTAAAIAYGVQQGFLDREGTAQKKELALVFDLGGGTFDVTLMDIDGQEFNAVATGGDVYLGGIDWDRRILQFIASEFESQFGIDPRDDPSSFQRLMREAEDAKHSLTARDEVSIRFEFDGKRLQTVLTRTEFESLTADLLERTLFTVGNVLKDAGRKWDDITRLLLVGGSSRMPMVAKALEKKSGLQVDRSLSPDEAVAHGAAIYADLILSTARKVPPKLSVSNVNSHDLGVLGIESKTGAQRRHIMIARNSSLPAKASARFVTQHDNQINVIVNVVEGGDASGRNATAIGKCTVEDLPPGLPAKSPIEVVFNYAANGRLQVEAIVVSAKKKASLTIERPSGMSPENIALWKERMEAGLEIGSAEPPPPPTKDLLTDEDFADSETEETEVIEVDDDGSEMSLGEAGPEDDGLQDFFRRLG